MKQLLLNAMLVLLLFGGCGTGSEKTEPAPQAEIPQPVKTPVAEKSSPEPRHTELAANSSIMEVKNPLDLSYITNDYEGAVILHPSHLLGSKLLLSLVKIDPEITQSFDKAMADGQEQIGIDPRKIKQIIILVDKQLAATNPATLVPGLGGAALKTDPEIRQVSDEKDDPRSEKKELQKQEEKGLSFPDDKPGSVNENEEEAAPDFGDLPDVGPPPTPSVIIRFTEPQDEQTLLAKLPVPPEKKDFQGKTYYSSGEINAHFADKNTLLLGRESLLQNMMSTKKSESLLLDRLARVDAENDMILVMDLSGHRKQIEGVTQNAGQGVHPILAGLIGMASKVRSLTITIGLSGDSLLNLVLQAYDEESSKQLGNTIEGLVGFAKISAIGGLDEAKNDPTRLPPGSQPMIPLLEDLLERITVTKGADDTILNIGKPEGFENLSELLKPIFSPMGEIPEEKTE